MNERPILGISMGDPFGNGPEITVRALAGKSIYDRCRPLVVGDKSSMEYAAKVAKKIGVADLKVNAIQDAKDAVTTYFEAEFKGCTLTQLCYSGDASADLFTEWAEECEADEAIVLYSSFDTDASGGDGSLEPNTTYDDFQWILVRDNGGTWEVKTYGYG